MKLFLDTTDNNKIKLAVEVNSIKDEIISKEYRSSKILPQILKLLKKNNASLRDLKSIYVSLGPGSFTGIRVGVSIANALGEVLSIPVNGKMGELVEPKYK